MNETLTCLLLQSRNSYNVYDIVHGKVQGNSKPKILGKITNICVNFVRIERAVYGK